MITFYFLEGADWSCSQLVCSVVLANTGFHYITAVLWPLGKDWCRQLKLGFLFFSPNFCCFISCTVVVYQNHLKFRFFFFFFFSVFILQMVKVRKYLDLSLHLNLLCVHTVLLQHLPALTNHSNFWSISYAVLDLPRAITWNQELCSLPSFQNFTKFDWRFVLYPTDLKKYCRLNKSLQ